MKKHLLMLFAVIVAATMSLRAQTIVIDDGFENGIQDSVWTQEFVRGEHPWAVESIEDSVQWPATIWQGSKRAYLRNTSGETQGYVTRLVSKVMDLRPEKVYQPELTFWYANPKWTADRDTLRVLYRTDQNAKWKQLAEFSKASANWQKVTLSLPEVNATYQVAFEGTDNLGRGIVLDSVKLRSAPECTVPHDITVNNKGAGFVNIAWNASWDANHYELIVITDKIDPDTIANVPDSAIAYHGLVDGLQQNYDLKLTSGEYYYVYLRSICDGENSAWNSEDPKQGSQPFYFRVKATKNVPYHYEVDYPYEAGIVRRDLEWTWGNNTGKYNPFINVYQNETERANYSKDATSCIVFTGANNTSTAIPAGLYAYVATPALADTANANFALNQCQVHFWSTVYTYTGRNYAHSLIVGAMTDPEDITTFVPVDTVSVWGGSTFVENIVDLSSYNGDGAYVAFASAFDKQNIFFLDDITIEYKKQVNKVTNIKVNPRDTWAEISWEGNASRYEILITNEEVNPAKPSAAAVVDSAVVTTNSYKIESLEADHSWNRPYYVYVKAEGADWSYRYPFVTIAAKEIPYTYDFEQTSGVYYIGGNATVLYPTTVGTFSNDPDYPRLSTTNARASKSCLNMTKDAGNDSWVTFPIPNDSLKNLQVKFYLSGNTTPQQAHATLGVMTNPMDIETFIPVSDFTLASTGYTVCYANFLNYDGPEGIIAIVWTDVEEGSTVKTINYIDDVTIEPLAKCLPPMDIRAEATTDSVTIAWNKSEATTFEFVFATKKLTDNQANSLTFDSISHLSTVLYADTLVWNDPLNDPTFGFGGLDYNTPYYIYVRTICGEEKTWWVELSFKTPCPDNFPIPFFEDFNSYESVNQEAGCWVLHNQTATSAYPKVMSLTVGGASQMVLELYSTSTATRSWAVVPGAIDDFSKLALSFDTRTWGSATTSKAVLYVGSMADVDNQSTFVAVDTFYLTGSSDYTHINMDLANYNFAYNNIVFTSGLADTMELATSDVALDNVLIKPNTCLEAWNIEAKDVQTNSIDIKWQGKSTNDEWYVKVMQDTNFIALDTVTGKAYHIEGLTPVQTYTFSIKANCDTTWSEASFMTACLKLDPSKPNKEDFESIETGTSYNAAFQIPCWTAGNAVANATTSYLPYVYKSATYASSGTNTYRVNESSSYAPAYVASPEIDIDHMKNLAVTFNVYSSTSYYFVFGVMSDPTDLSTFVAIDSVKGTGKSVQFTYDLSEYADSIPATAKYCCWRGRYAAADLFYLDDVSIIKVTCPLPKPSYSNLTAEQVRISSGIRTDNDWILLVTNKYVHPDTLVKEGYVVPDSIIVFNDTIDSRAKIVTGLNEQTDYYVAVATVCEDGLSAWATTSFKTPCLAVTPEAMGTITFSKEEGYETGSGKKLPCWTTGNKTNSSSTSYIPYIGTTTSYMHNGYNYLQVYSYVPSSSTGTSYEGAYAIMPELNVDAINKYQVNFWARTNSSTTASYRDKLIVGVITDPSDLNTFVVVDTLKLSHTAYEPFSVSLENYQGDYLGNQGKYIMLMTETGSTPGTLAYGYAYISEISVEAIPTCVPVKTFAVDSIAEDAAVVSFAGKSPSYRILLADKALTEEEKATYEWLLDSTITKTDSILITGLKFATQYYMYAQALCDGGDSSSISMSYAFFTTNCPEKTGFPIPYTQDFEKYPTSSLVVDCWDLVNYATGTGYPKILKPTSGAVSGNQLELYSTSTTQRNVAIMPKVQGNLTDYMLSFDARSYGTSGKSILYIGTMDDVLDSVAGFAPFDTLYMTTGNEFYHKDLVLADYAEKLIHSRIAFSSGLGETLEMTSDMYLDNVKIGMPPSCFAPKLEAGNTTMYAAKINITPAKEWNDKWQLAIIADSIYTAKGFDLAAYLDTTASAIVTVDTTEYEIKDLDPGTVYQIFGRTVCGGEDGNSDWTNFPVKIRTKYYYKDSYFFGFEKDEGWEFCQGSTSTTYYIHPALEVGYNGGSATTSYTSYYPYSMESTSSAVYSWGNKPTSGTATDPWPDGKGVLRWNATASYYGGYVIFPAIAEPKDRSFEFDLRNCYLTYSTMKPSTPNENLKIEIGTIEQGKGYETYEVIANIFMPKTDATLVAKAANNYLFKKYTLDVDSATLATKQIVIRAPKQEASVYPYIDNVTLGAPKGFEMVSIKKVQAEATKATVTWDSLGGPWNLYITSYNAKTKKTDTVASYLNLAVTSQEVTGLSAQSSYTAVLVAANAPEGTKYETSASKAFKTPCMPLNPNAKGEFVWDFNERDGWERSDIQVGGTAANTTDTCYLKPECFTVGTTYTGTQSTSTIYYNWLIQRKGYAYTSAPTGKPSTTYAHYEYGRDDSPALRVYTSSTYMTPYIVLPELNCSFDTMMVEFWGRCLANYDETHGTASNQNKMVSASYCGGNYSQKMVVGTLTDPNDFSTLQVIDTVTYNAYTSTTADYVTNDPSGNRYWQQFRLPLGSAKGKYIVLFQAAYGLFFLDDLKVAPVGDNLFAPSGANTSNVTANSATFSWDAKHPTLPSVVVLLDISGNEITRDTLAGGIATLTIDTLSPGTAYQWYVYQCNGAITSAQSAALSFNTECLQATPDYKTGFELEDGWKLIPGQTSETYKQTQCWVYGNAGTATSWSSSYDAYNRPSSTTASYNCTKDGAYGIWMYAYSTTYQPYIVTPRMDVNAYDTLQVNFWMRPGYHSPSTGKITYQYTLGSTQASADYYYSKSIIVGTMTDPYDASTFVAIDTVSYLGTFAVGDVANEANAYLFQKKKVALTGATGPYVAFMTTLYAKGETRKSTYGYMGLDDISFSAIQHCDAPEELKSSDISATKAALSWEKKDGAQQYILQVSTDLYFLEDTAFVFNDTIDTTSIVVDNLLPYTEYIWRVRTLCGEELGESEFSQNASFTTARVPYYNENFSDATLDGDWSFGTTPAVNVIDSVGVEITGQNNATYGFKRVTTNYGINGPHYVVPCYTSSNTTLTYRYYWMISPVISLNDSAHAAHLTMDMALTQVSTSTPSANKAQESNMADDYTFMIIISDDAGKTWKKENVVGFWNNTMAPGNQLRDIPATAANIRIDLAKYAGKDIRVAFYREAFTYISTNCGIHIGNIRVNYYDKIEDNAQACQYQDIDKLGFYIDGDIAAAGDTTYRRLEKASDIDAYKKAYRDSLYTLDVTYIGVAETIVNDTICDGDTYTDLNFHGKDRAGVYRRKLQSVESCDSLVTLYLYVTPRAYAEDEIQNVCPGETYTWNGQVYDRAGVYYDTTVSVAGCDSIQTLVLQYFDPEDTITDAVRVPIDSLPYTYQNEQYPYAAGQAPIIIPAGTAEGDYIENAMVQGQNCTAYIIVTITVYDDHEGINNIDIDADGTHKIIYRDNMYIKTNGTWYNASGQKVADPRK